MKYGHRMMLDPVQVKSTTVRNPDAKPHLPFLADDLQMSLEVAFSQARARFEQPETAGAK
jgi:hypothetical protein